MRDKENSHGLLQDVLTLDEVTAFLRIPAEKLIPEIAAGRLQALRIADEVRILKSDLINYLELAKTGAQGPTHSRVKSSLTEPVERLPEVTLDPAKPFEHIWPNRQKEHYTESYAGRAEVNGSLRSVAIGFTERQSAGRLRKRAVVFVDRRPMVEFVAADEFEKSGKMLSLVKRKNGKRLRPGETAPGEYKHMKIEPYRKYVTGAYASSNQALVCTKNDLKLMAEHALVRLRQIESR